MPAKTRHHPSRAVMRRIVRALDEAGPLVLADVAMFAGVPQHIARRALRRLEATPHSNVWSYLHLVDGARRYMYEIPF